MDLNNPNNMTEMIKITGIKDINRLNKNLNIGSSFTH